MIHVNERSCPQNHPCPAVGRCPEGAIVQYASCLAPSIDDERCTDCGTCMSVCGVFTQMAETAGVR